MLFALSCFASVALTSSLSTPALKNGLSEAFGRKQGAQLLLLDDAGARTEDAPRDMAVVGLAAGRSR